MRNLNELIKIVENLKKSQVREVIKRKMKDFENLGKRDSNELFKELCFCLMTANFNAEKCIIIQNKINNKLLHLSEKELAKELSRFGHRFPNTRAKFIFEARKYKKDLKEILNSFEDENLIRVWLVKNIKGLGFKEASHFLRNIGFKNISIIDFHIIDLLVKNHLLQKPKTMTPKKYLEIEEILKKVSKKTQINLGELDLYLWYKETGKILK